MYYKRCLSITTENFTIEFIARKWNGSNPVAIDVATIKTRVLMLNLQIAQAFFTDAVTGQISVVINFSCHLKKEIHAALVTPHITWSLIWTILLLWIVTAGWSPHREEDSLKFSITGVKIFLLHQDNHQMRKLSNILKRSIKKDMMTA